MRDRYLLSADFMRDIHAVDEIMLPRLIGLDVELEMLDQLPERRFVSRSDLFMQRFPGNERYMAPVSK